MATRTIATRLTLEGEKEYKKELGEVNQEIGLLSDKMKRADAEFRGQANSIEALTTKNDLLREAQQKQIDKIEVLSIAPLIADALNAVFDDTSVSEIFGGENQS